MMMRNRSLFLKKISIQSLAMLTLCAASLGVEVLTPEEELKTLKLADGLQANLFASEELGVLNPMQMRFDDKGRLFVISTLGYPQLKPGEKPQDKIVMLEDRDGDGRADKSTVFADGLNIPTGLEPGDGGLYVGEQTELIHLKDTDGDGKADVRKVVLSGFGVGDTHQAINSFVWSPGSELYFDQGDGIESRIETPWGTSSLFQAGVMRFRPRRLQVDPILDDFMGPGNPWGIAFDDWGQCFVVDGAGGITFLSPAMMPAKRRLRLRTIGRPGGYCGVDILGSKHLPEDMQGDFILGDFKENRIKRFEAVPEGAGFKVKWKEPLVESSHRNFRPVDVRIGPDGAFYICDWYNSIICHQDDPFRHPDRDFAHGRIWRISHKSNPPVKKLDLQGMSNEQLFEQLASGERWVRYQSKRVLANRDRRAVAGSLRAWLRSNKHQDDRHLLELLGVFESIEIVDSECLNLLLRAETPKARAYAARVVGRWHDRLESPLEFLATAIVDDDPTVRMEAIVSTAHIPDTKAIEVAAIAADRSIDYDINYALTQATRHLQRYWLPAFRRGELTFGGKSNRLLAIMQRADSNEVTETLRSLASLASASASQRVALSALMRIGNEDDFRTVFDFAVKQNDVQLLRELTTRSRRPNGELQGGLSGLLKSSQPEIVALGIQLAGQWKVRELQSRIDRIAVGADSDQRLVAIASLGRMDNEDATKTLCGIAKNDASLNARVSATVAVCRADQDGASRLLEKLLASDMPLSDGQVAKLMSAFLSHNDGVVALVSVANRVDLRHETALQMLAAFSSLGRSDRDLIDVLNDAAGIVETLPDHSDDQVAEIVKKIQDGDPYRGEDIFRSKSTNCYSCHQIGGVGGVTGPDLTSVGTTLPRDRLVQKVFWPQRQVKEGYTLVQLLTKNGRILRGYERKTSDKKYRLLRPLDSEEMLRIKKSDIDERDEVGSAMPQNIVAALSEKDRMDLLAFLSQLGAPGEYRIDNVNTVRQWRVITGDDISASNWQSVSAGDWGTLLARVSGESRLAELATDHERALLLTDFETTKEKRRLVITGESVQKVWVDGIEVELDESIDVDLESGDHELAVLVDLRSKATIKVQWQVLK